jgi:hypothetical protein
MVNLMQNLGILTYKDTMQVPSFGYKTYQGWKTRRGNGCYYTALHAPTRKDEIA